MGNQQATDLEIGWLAGIADGEAYIGISIEKEHWYRKGYNTRQYSVRLEFRVTNTDKAIVDKAANIMRRLGLSVYERAMKNCGSPVKKRVYDAAIKRMKPLKALLALLEPYLTGNKQERARLMLKFIELREDNTGIPNPAYADGRKGRWGPRTIRPYTDEEVECIRACRQLQMTGASETTRRKREAQFQQFVASNALIRTGQIYKTD